MSDQNAQFQAEFNARAALQNEFGTVEIYAAYRRAEVAGRIKSRAANPRNASVNDADPKRAEFRAIWDGVLAAHHHQYASFEAAFAIWKKTGEKIAAEQVFKQQQLRMAAIKREPLRPIYKVHRS